MAAAREAAAEQDDRQGGTYRLELVRCGKDRCTRCADGPAHGPYWYRYYRGRGGKLVSRYVGKTLPAADTARALSGDTAVPEPPGPAASADERIRQAVGELASGRRGWVSLSRLREHLAELPRADVDAALYRLGVQPGVYLQPETGPGRLTGPERAAALSYGGENVHLISIEPDPGASYRSGSPVSAQARDAAEHRIRQAVTELAAAPGPLGLGREPGGWVSLRRLREHLADLPRADVDAALYHMALQPGVYDLIPEADQKILTQADWDTGLRIGDQVKHLISIRPGQGRAPVT